MTIEEIYENLSFSFRALAKSAGKLAKENEELKKKLSEVEAFKKGLAIESAKLNERIFNDWIQRISTRDYLKGESKNHERR